jgi:hypothetical protein
MAVVATMTRGTVTMREEFGLLLAGIEAIRKYQLYIRILYWHVYEGMSTAAAICSVYRQD